MSDDAVGYVYILTNPSFREDWIKVGMSSKEVDIRSKELDNTAVPLPFEIYATLKTKKYKQVEKNLHQIFTKLAGARIRKGREFFNIKPDEATEYLKLQASLLEDAILNTPDENVETDDNSKKTVRHKGSYKVDTDQIFYMLKDNVNAKMKIIDGDKFVVLVGSKIDTNVYSSQIYVEKIRKEHSDKLDNNIVIHEIEFATPSAAGIFVRGGSVNGKEQWKTKENQPLKDFIKYDNDTD